MATTVPNRFIQRQDSNMIHISICKLQQEYHNMLIFQDGNQQSKHWGSTATQ